MRNLRVLCGFGIALLGTVASAVNFQTAGPVDSNAPTSNANAFDDKPDIVTDGTGHWVAVWETSEFGSGSNPFDLNIAVSRSSDNGASWTAPIILNQNAGTDSVDDATPSLATDGAGTWVCAYTGIAGATAHRAVLTSKSTNNGATWSAPTPVNPDFPAEPFSYTPSICSDGNGHWVVVWNTTYKFSADETAGDEDIAVSTSTDGVSWTAPARLNSQGGSEVASDSLPKVASDGNGVWVCAWASDYDRGLQEQGDREIMFSRSINNGATWSVQSVLNSEFDTETGLDEALALAADGAGNWIITWEGNLNGGVYRVWTSSSSDDGATWSVRKQISDDPPLGDSVVPDIATDRAGKWVVVWQRRLLQGSHTDDDIAQAESSNNGATWSAVANVNSNAITDTMDDRTPCIATDGSDHWAVLWQTFDAAHADHDVWRAISGGGGGASLTLVAPNGGEKWKAGSKHKIEWNTSGSSGNKVKLELLRNGSVVDTIKSSTGNDGKLRWKLPDSLTIGTGYKVRVTSKTNGAITDESDGTFRVKSAK